MPQEKCPHCGQLIRHKSTQVEQTEEKNLIAQKLFDYSKLLFKKPRMTSNELYLRNIVRKMAEGYSEYDMAHALIGMANSVFHLQNGLFHINYAARPIARPEQLISKAQEAGITTEESNRRYDEFSKLYETLDIQEIIDLRKEEKILNKSTGVELK